MRASARSAVPRPPQKRPGHASGGPHGLPGVAGRSYTSPGKFMTGNRRVVIGIVICVGLGAAAWAAWWRGTRPTTNVLLITLDTTRADRLGCYGYSQAQTPALDRLA